MCGSRLLICIATIPFRMPKFVELQVPIPVNLVLHTGGQLQDTSYLKEPLSLQLLAAVCFGCFHSKADIRKLMLTGLQPYL